MQKMESGNVTSDARAMRQSIRHSAIRLTTGSTVCPAPSGIMCASGGSKFSILSTIIVLISPMEWFSTLPSGACRKRSARRSRRLSNTAYAILCEVPVDRLNVRIFAA